MKWRRVVPGEYVSEDGEWLISKEGAWTFCDNPHPQPGGHCWGGEEHWYTFWMISKKNEQGSWREYSSDDCRTLRAAKEVVEQEVVNEHNHREGLRAVR